MKRPSFSRRMHFVRGWLLLDVPGERQRSMLLRHRISLYLFHSHVLSNTSVLQYSITLIFFQAQVRKATAGRGGAGGGAGGRAGAGSSNILQFYTDDSPGLQVGPTTVLVASLSFVGLVVLLHIWGKFRM